MTVCMLLGLKCRVPTSDDHLAKIRYVSKSPYSGRKLSLITPQTGSHGGGALYSQLDRAICQLIRRLDSIAPSGSYKAPPQAPLTISLP